MPPASETGCLPIRVEAPLPAESPVRSAGARIAETLSSIGIDRTLVRIFDSLLWSCYQTAGPYAEFGPRLTRWHEGKLFFPATTTGPVSG